MHNKIFNFCQENDDKDDNVDDEDNGADNKDENIIEFEVSYIFTHFSKEHNACQWPKF